MKSNFSRSIRFHSWTSSNWTQKKVTETKVEKILDRTLKMAFFTPWFLGFTTIIVQYQFFIWYFYEQISKKKLLKCTTAISESVKVVDFDDLFLTAIFA